MNTPSSSSGCGEGKVRILNGVLDEFTTPGGGKTIVLRGVIDPRTYEYIQFDIYQRDILSPKKIRSITEALRRSSVPDVELGMRGGDCKSRTDDKDGEVFVLNDPVFGIDGLQRITGAKLLLQREPGAKPRLGAVVHFKTTFDWERERFRILNQDRTKLSANVLLRNLRSENSFVDMLYRLSHNESSFALNGRVQWKQRMVREDILPALVLAKVVGVLHSRFGPGRSSSYDELAASLESTMKKVTKSVMRANIMTFFDIIDKCFSIRKIVYIDRAPQVKSSFLSSVAEVFVRHSQFWNGALLNVDLKTLTRLGEFPITDPNISNLASSSGPSRQMLYQLLLEHLNKGKHKRLIEDDISGSDVPVRQAVILESQAKPIANTGRSGPKALEKMFGKKEGR